MSPHELVRARLEQRDCNPRGPEHKFAARCPAHEDHVASLTVGLGADGRVLMNCHAGCETEAVLRELQLAWADLYPEGSAGNGHGEILEAYRYVDEHGGLLYEVVRKPGKKFCQRRPDGKGGWIWKLDRTRRVLYRLPEVLEAVKTGQRIWIAEGERDVHALEAAGEVATCNPGGANKWRSEYSKHLEDASVTIVADRDTAGREHAKQVAASLTGIAAHVLILEPAEGKDAADHLAAGRTLDELAEMAAPDDPEPTDGRCVRLTAARAIRSERVRWLWRDRLPLRSLSVVAGEKGLGKSLLTNARLVAEATRGRLPGELEGNCIDVLVVTAEDDWASVVKPRLIAHDADLDRVHRVSLIDEAGESLLTLPDDVSLLEDAIEQLRAAGRVVGMIVIDPIGAFLSQGTDTHRDASVRRTLAPLAGLAERLNLVVVVVAHLTKDESTRLINRVSGAGAFVNAARSLLVLARSPDDPAGEQGNERVLVHVGSNWGRLAPSLAARIESRDVNLDDGSQTSIGHLLITGETNISVEDLQRGRDENTGTDTEEAIGAALIDGPKPSRDVKTQLVAELDCSKRTIQRAAIRMSDNGDLIIESAGFPRTTTWTLRSRDKHPPDSRDTHPNAVETNTNTRRVSTSSRDVFTEDSPPSRDSGDTPQRDVSTDADAEAERLAAKYPELQ